MTLLLSRKGIIIFRVCHILCFVCRRDTHKVHLDTLCPTTLIKKLIGMSISKANDQEMIQSHFKYSVCVCQRGETIVVNHMLITLHFKSIFEKDEEKEASLLQ